MFNKESLASFGIQIASLCIGRDSVGVALLGDNLFAVGGFDGHQYLKTVEKYDVDKNEWSEVSPLVYGRAAACVIAVPNFITSSPTPVWYFVIIVLFMDKRMYCSRLNEINILWITLLIRMPASQFNIIRWTNGEFKIRGVQLLFRYWNLTIATSILLQSFVSYEHNSNLTQFLSAS